MRRRAVMTWCPVTTCNAVTLTSPAQDPGLLWLSHVQTLHPELVYTQAEQERCRLALEAHARRN